MLSLGTGQLTRKIYPEEAKDWGLVQWARPALSIMFNASSIAADYQMKQQLGDNYLRLQRELTVANDDMDDATARNIKALQFEAQELLKARGGALSEFVRSRILQ